MNHTIINILRGSKDLKKKIERVKGPGKINLQQQQGSFSMQCNGECKKSPQVMRKRTMAMWTIIGRAGILTLPYAVSSGGWLSLLCFLIIAGLTCYTSLLIRRCMDIDENIRSFPDIGHRAFGPNGRTLVSIVIYAQLYLLATGFLIMEGDNLHNLFPNISYKIGPFVFGGRKSFILLVGVLVLPTTWLKNMNLFSYISATGVMAAFVVLGSVLWLGAFDGVGFHEKGVLINLKGIPQAVSLHHSCDANC
ncbi:amino acid transporter AVT1I-like [Henckelia pumila]|uniref:amino acid transporter AVT1I-like n=1 Tax=Henckelia pumila TaxID=405737 RepID=UPI003C6DF389